ncbi:MAG: hypothetical protein K1Y36_08350 [Blastocatellia bacterium]|nr:hypothetical protein [Blastocatellia bacterium]
MKVTDLFASNWLSPAAEKKQILFWVLAITIAPLLCFGGCIRNGYVIDDALIVENNPNAATLKRVGYVLTHEHWGSLNQPINPGAVYRPITMISFQATSTVWGNSAPAHHAVNLALHLCNSLLVAACVLIF